jgi:hypothetical protein
MSYIFANRVKVNTSTTGTGNITLGAAATGFQTFAQAGVANNSIVSYLIEDGPTNWEIGRGTYNNATSTMVRTVLESTNSNSAINLSGSAIVAITLLAEDITDGNTYKSEEFTGANSVGPFTLIENPISKDSTFVSINGVFQPKSAYTLSGANITFSEAVPNNVPLSISYLYGMVRSDTQGVNYAYYSGNGTTGPYTLSKAPAYNAALDIYIDGILQIKDGSAYTVSGSNITFSEALSNTTIWEEKQFSTFSISVGTPDDGSVGANSINTLQANAILTVLGGASNTYVNTQLDTKAANSYVNTLLATTHATKTTIPTAANLNTYTTTGIYEQVSNAQAAAGSNYPVPVAGMLTVTSTDPSSFVYQMYQAYNFGSSSAYPAKVYFRCSYLTVWSAWTEVNSWGVTHRVVTATTDTLIASDAGKMIICSNNSPVTVTIPTNASVPLAGGTIINIEQYGTGQITVANTSGVTLRSSGSKTKLYGQYSVASLHKIGTDEWLLFGDITT